MEARCHDSTPWPPDAVESDEPTSRISARPGATDISKGEFVQHVRRLGVTAQKKDIETLFRDIDSKGSGSLEVPLYMAAPPTP